MGIGLGWIVGCSSSWAYSYGFVFVQCTLNLCSAVTIYFSDIMGIVKCRHLWLSAAPDDRGCNFDTVSVRIVLAVCQPLIHC